MTIVVALLATLACQQPPAPVPLPPAPQPVIRIPSGIDWSRETATTPPSATAPVPTPSVADLFRERAAREAAARAQDPAPSSPVADGQYHCRRTETGMTCGNDEAAMRRSEEAAKARLREMLDPPN